MSSMAKRCWSTCRPVCGRDCEPAIRPWRRDQRSCLRAPRAAETVVAPNGPVIRKPYDVSQVTTTLADLLTASKRERSTCA